MRTLADDVGLSAVKATGLQRGSPWLWQFLQLLQFWQLGHRLKETEYIALPITLRNND